MANIQLTISDITTEDLSALQTFLEAISSSTGSTSSLNPLQDSNGTKYSLGINTDGSIQTNPL